MQNGPEAVAQHRLFLWITTLPTHRSNIRINGHNDLMVQQ